MIVSFETFMILEIIARSNRNSITILPSIVFKEMFFSLSFAHNSSGTHVGNLVNALRPMMSTAMDSIGLKTLPLLGKMISHIYKAAASY